MKIGIVTVYDGVSNIGSYLQAYAMQTALEQLGHQVFFVEKTSVSRRVWQHVAQLNPKRAFFLRLQSGWNYLRAARRFRFVSPGQTHQLDGLLFGSDEIWNMDNPFFRDPLFFGTGMQIPRIAYAVSVGAMAQKTLDANAAIAEGAKSFAAVLARDERTQTMMGKFLQKDLPIVCDPTLLVGTDPLQMPVKLPEEPYMLVYSYGLEEPMEGYIRRFAKEKGLKLVSAHFWHPFCDRVIPCKPLEFGSLMAGAEYVFTSTFHGAVFAMMNHTRCAILPVREKVAYVAGQLAQEGRLVYRRMDYDTFRAALETPFDAETFEARLAALRKLSMDALKEALECLKS